MNGHKLPEKILPVQRAKQNGLTPAGSPGKGEKTDTAQMRPKGSLLLFFTACFLIACAPQFSKPVNMTVEPRITATEFISFDGTRLPLKTWLPAGSPEAVFIALHGFNDYSNFIRDPAPFFTARGIIIYAFDQRGFGKAPNRGGWSGTEVMGKDLGTIVDLVRYRHPDIPLYLLGDSMGGAVILTAGSTGHPLPVSGVILVAPAVWSRATMPFYQRWALWLGARIAPRLKLSAKPLDIIPSDNREMLMALGCDPLVIKETRIEAVYGLANLMDDAYTASSGFDQKTLILYGARDEIIPPRPMADVYRKRLEGKFLHPQRLLVYENGYHMLLRDLQAEVVWNDIILWLKSSGETFPSVEGHKAHEITREGDITAFIYPARK